MKKIVAVIPARLHSKRFPKKILEKIHGKTLLEHVWTKAIQNECFSEVIFAIDHPEVGEVLDRFKAPWQMTSIHCNNGTERLIDLQNKSGIEADIWVNWQADEPLISQEMIRDLLQGIHGEGIIWTLKKKISKEEALSPHVCKVVTDRLERALYFSRSLIPYDRDRKGSEYFKHIGLYAYTTHALEEIQKISYSPLKEAESLEQLAFLEHGLSIYVYETQFDSVGVDVKEDLLKVERLLINS